MENSGKTAVFQGGYGPFGEIQLGRIWPDWGVKRGDLSLKCYYNRATMSIVTDRVSGRLSNCPY